MGTPTPIVPLVKGGVPVIHRGGGFVILKTDFSSNFSAPSSDFSGL